MLGILQIKNILISKNKYIQKIITNIPNIFTLSRLFLSFPLILFLELNKTDLVFLLVVVGGITDYLDGFFARKLNRKTKFGTILDPLTDKIFLLIPLLWLCKVGIIPFWSLGIILLRELIISALRTTIENGLPASNLGKYKTFSFFIALLIFFLPFKIDLLSMLGILFYWLGFVLTIITFIDYLGAKKNMI